MEDEAYRGDGQRTENANEEEIRDEKEKEEESSREKRIGIRKKIKRKKSMAKNLSQLKMYFVNVRGIKSKIEQVRKIIKEEDPDIIGMVETMMAEKDELEIEGYKMLRNDRNEEGGGVMVAVKEKYKNIVIEVSREKDMEESLWMVFGSREKMRIGVVYAPQESRTIKKELKKMYVRIEEQLEEARKKGQSVFVMEDLNCKIGEWIEGNGVKVTKGGRLLKSLVEKNRLIVVNGTKECEGMWTRDEKGNKSVIDYILVGREDEKRISKMKIDEGKLMTPYRVDSEKKKVYTDHNAIMVTYN